jgi:phosphoribosylformylglycinamidine synthase subunit PurQ / glutaminase
MMMPQAHAARVCATLFPRRTPRACSESMPQPRVLVLRAPGANCDVETQFAFEQAGGVAERVHVNRLLEAPRLLDGYQILCVPGGFSYGDDLGAGRILAVQIQTHLRDALADFVAQGKLVLGICNGFQVLLKSGLLLPPDETGPVATLAWNESGRFQDRWVRLRCTATSSGSPCVFFRGIERLYLPVAHAEGRFITRDAAVLQRLEAACQLPLRYAPLNGECSRVGSSGAEHLPFPDNPNGSQADIAGVCDATGRVCGLMPHPERHIDPTQHPRWTRLKELPAAGDGLAVFRNGVEFFA